MKREDITPEVVRELFDYDPETGALTWRRRTSSKWHKSERGVAIFNGRFAGSPALACIDQRGYMHGHAFGLKLYAQRVAFCHFHGRWPEHNIDHDNGVRHDNRIENLFDRPQVQNARNMRRNRQNTSGVTGVSWDTKNNRWRACIGLDHKTKCLGRYRNKRNAETVRKLAERLLGYHPNHGRAA